MRALTTILHATDLSHLPANAFHAAHALAQQHGARLILLYVELPQATVEGEFGLMPPEPQPSDEEILEQLGEMLPEDSAVQAEILVEHGRPAEAIARVAKQHHGDLFVRGAHGRRGLGRLFHANVADHVTRSAPCPVLALRSPLTEAPEPTAAPQAA
jgi:nucleotide-binding universal stress UspA family protein